MNLAEAVAQGILRVRRKPWSKHAYMLIHLNDDGTPNLWVDMFDRPAQATIGAKTPNSLWRPNDTHDDFVKYTGPLDHTDTEGKP